MSVCLRERVESIQRKELGVDRDDFSKSVVQRMCTRFKDEMRHRDIFLDDVTARDRTSLLNRFVIFIIEISTSATCESCDFVTIIVWEKFRCRVHSALVVEIIPIELTSQRYLATIN